jgi:hypothetical protein
MRYFFHLESDAGTRIHLDHLGRDFSDAQGAGAHAVAMARKLAREDAWLGWSVRVIDSANTEIIRVPVRDPLLAE